ncbi:Hint domain-containing protein [Streptomyces noursei]|uniref:Hint domain-containing protein n=1 Tax=Streptomyces noursei TaxID=1971 RepID=UPI0030F348BF
MCDILADADNIANAAQRAREVEKALAGLESLEACTKDGGDILACGDLFKDVLLSSKLKALRTSYETLSNPASRCSQFSLAGTKVLMGDGPTRNIEDIRTGDQVLATDPVSGKMAPRQVSRKIVTEHDKHFNELTISTGRGLEKLTATNEHPFWQPV